MDKKEKINKYFEEQKIINPNLTREEFDFIIYNNDVSEKEKNLLKSETYRESKGEYNSHNDVVIFLLKNGIRLDKNFINYLKKRRNLISETNINSGEFHQVILNFVTRDKDFKEYYNNYDVKNDISKNIVVNKNSNKFEEEIEMIGIRNRINLIEEIEEKIKLEISSNDKIDVSKLNKLLLDKNKLFNIVAKEYIEKNIIPNNVLSALDDSIPTLTKEDRKSFLDFPIEPRTNYKLETDVEKIKKMDSYFISGTKDLIEEKNLDKNMQRYYEKVKENFSMLHKEIIYKGEKLERKENVTTFKKQTILEFKYYDSKNNEYKMLKDKLYIKKGKNFEEVKDFNIENKIKQSSSFNSDITSMNNN